jgi:urea transport system permease protein
MKQVLAFFPRSGLIVGAVILAFLVTYPFYGAEFRVSMLGMFLCFAIFAMSVDLIWGFTGILSLGQAVYFGMGAYFVALSLKISYATVNATRYGGTLPDFMEWNGLTELPQFMEPLKNIYFACAMGLLFPLVFSFIFGFFTFKRHIYGVYCAVITLAEALILEQGIVEFQAYTGGFNGITEYGHFATTGFFMVILAITVGVVILVRMLTYSRFGTILKSIRDNEMRAEFMGFEVANYKMFVFCVSSIIAAVAGGLYAAWVGIVSFLDAGPGLSLESVIWVAVGGRGTIIGPVIGTLLVKGAEFFLSEKLQWIWQLFMGALFILVVMIAPDGIVGSIANRLKGKGTDTPIYKALQSFKNMFGSRAVAGSSDKSTSSASDKR